MIAHIVLFRPKAELSPQERDGIGAAFADAVKDIDAIRSVRVGRRILIGRGYEQLMTEDFTHAAILEFDDRAGLQAYLEHPTHTALAARFFAIFDRALMYDYELGDASHVERLTHDTA